MLIRRSGVTRTRRTGLVAVEIVLDTMIGMIAALVIYLIFEEALQNLAFWLMSAVLWPIL